MKIFCCLAITASLGVGVTAAHAAGPTILPAALRAVTFTPGFWASRLETNRTVTLPHNWDECVKTGRIRNFERAAGKLDGAFEGIYFDDSDVYKMVEGAAFTLAKHPDAELDKKLDELIATFAAAQQPDGYLYTFYTVNKTLDQRFSDLRSKHELYCAGHLIEAAVAHHQATGKRNLLDIAIKYADLIDKTFGPDKRHGVPGHEELELALFKLADDTGEARYRKLAEFFVNERGRENDGRKLFGPYNQDGTPVVDSTEVVGHAVRQMYLMCAATDVAIHNDDEEQYTAAVDRLWKNLVERKMYITGGVGARHKGEAFGDDYDLPNDSAYAETCAGIGAMLWNARMSRLHGDAKYFDSLERTLYNGFLSGVSLKGDRFFYVNPLASAGDHHRQDWYKVACCPPNVLRFMASLPTLSYSTSYDDATQVDRIYVNLFSPSMANFTLHGGAKLTLTQTTNYPWDGKVQIKVEGDVSPMFELLLRLPGWAKDPTLKVNETVGIERTESGYAVISGTWHSGDTVELNLPMPIERVHADPRVKANVARVALQRGPMVYCVEGIDNDGKATDASLATNDVLTSEFRNDVLNGVTAIKSASGMTFVPYFAWDNRKPGEMAVWVSEK